jgi:hypothetical protein
MIGLIVMITGAVVGWKITKEVWVMKDGAERGLVLAGTLWVIAGGMVLLHKILTAVQGVIDDFIFNFELFSLGTLLVAAMAWLVVWFIRDAFFSKNAKFV